MHHHPIILLAKLGTKWTLFGLAVLIVCNPITIGVVLALFDHITHGNAGGKFLGAVPVEKSAYCDFYVAGHHLYIATDCANVHFRGAKRDA